MILVLVLSLLSLLFATTPEEAFPHVKLLTTGDYGRAIAEEIWPRLFQSSPDALMKEGTRIQCQNSPYTVRVHHNLPVEGVGFMLFQILSIRPIDENNRRLPIYSGRLHIIFKKNEEGIPNMTTCELEIFQRRY